MRRSFLLNTAALVGTLALGCGDQQSPTAPTDFSSPSFRATVARSSANFGFAFGNEERSVLIGGTAENWAAFCATGAEVWDTWEILLITRPDGSQRNTVKGENMNILVWNLPGATPFAGDICSASPDYTCTGKIVLTDSDVDLSGHGADATGQMVTGTVTDASGQRYHLVAVLRATVAPEITLDNFVFDEHFITRVAKIQLTPIGQ